MERTTDSLVLAVFQRDIFSRASPQVKQEVRVLGDDPRIFPHFRMRGHYSGWD